MTKKRYNARNKRGDKAKKMSIISFGKPEPVLTTGTDYRDIWYDNAADHFTQPIDRLALAQLINLNGQHGGIIHARKNMVTADYLGGGLTDDELEAAAFDYLTFGDVAIAKIRNGWGDVIGGGRHYAQIQLMTSADSATAPDPKGSCGWIIVSNRYHGAILRTAVFPNRAGQER